MFKEEIEEFNNTYLSFLQDEGFEIHLLEFSTIIQIMLLKRESVHSSEYFMWDDIKDQILSYLEQLMSNYKCISVQLHSKVLYQRYSPEFVLENGSPYPELREIDFFVSNK